MFKDIKSGYTVYLLKKENEIKAYTGKVVAVSPVRFQQPQSGISTSMMASSMVIDVTIEADGETKTYTMPESSTVVTAGQLVISTDRDGIIRDLEAMKSSSEEIIASVEKHKETVCSCEKVLQEWNPVFAEKKKQDERIAGLESKVDKISDMLSSFLEKCS